MHICRMPVQTWKEVEGALPGLVKTAIDVTVDAVGNPLSLVKHAASIGHAIYTNWREYESVFPAQLGQFARCELLRCPCWRSLVRVLRSASSL
jgi:hypothetical protein